MAQIKIDDDLLVELGLDKFSEEEKNKILKRIYEAMELQVGMRIAKIVSQDQLQQLEELTKANKHQEAAEWIKQHVPNYQQIAQEELEGIKHDIKETSRAVLEKSI